MGGAAAALFGLLAGGCDQAANGGAAGNAPSDSGEAVAASSSSGTGAGKDRYVIGVIPKSQSNPVYIAARSGAEQAQAEIAREEGVDIELRWFAPSQEDASRQVQFIRELVSLGVDGLAISCTDPITASPAINEAVAAGVEVLTFDSDAPGSSRFAYIGIDDGEAGKMVMNRLISSMEPTPEGETRRVAILAGNPTAENMRARVLGARDASLQHDDVSLIGVFRHAEDPLSAAAEMAEAHEQYGPIHGWALMGGWPLYDPSGLDGVPEGIPVVSMDPLPQALDFAEQGRVQALIAQPYFEWGHTGVRTLFEKLHEGRAPASAVMTAELEMIEGEGIERYRTRWRGWVGDVTVVVPNSAGQSSQD